MHRAQRDAPRAGQQHRERSERLRGSTRERKAHEITRVVLAIAAVAACGGGHAAPDATPTDAAAPDAPPDAAFEPTLFDTGLCVDRACTQLSPGVQTYTPRWTLWADGAVKRRFVYVPPGAQIDTSDMDHWEFPVGTKFWKEFSMPDGSGNLVRVETRLVQRVGSGSAESDWFYAPYEWNAANDDTTMVPYGVVDADGTTHDIPSRADCQTCHENLAPTRVLGFGALQLDGSGSAAGDLALADLVAANLLTEPPDAPPGGSGTPYWPMGSDTADALGYLHVNCGHCHNPMSSFFGSLTSISLRLEVATAGSAAETPTYLTTVGKTTTMAENGLDVLVDPGSPDTSVLIYRFEADPSEEIHMPPLAVKTIDPTGDATLRSWVANLPP